MWSVLFALLLGVATWMLCSAKGRRLARRLAILVGLHNYALSEARPDPVVPRDNEGYTTAFSWSDDGARQKEILAFWRKWGFVVIRDVLSPEQIEATKAEIFRHPDLNIKNKHGYPTKSRWRAEEWEDEVWPTSFDVSKKGFISPVADVNLTQSWINRQNPTVYKAFKLVWGRPDLWVTYGRYGLMRPTKDIKVYDADAGDRTAPAPRPGARVVGTVDKPEWLTLKSWLHWDQNPFEHPDFWRVQGLLTISDHTQNSGGFVCVPGFTHRFKDWMTAHVDDPSQRKRGGLIPLQLTDPVYEEVEKVLMRPGSLLVWDSRICHANYPNRSSKFRMVQYLSFMPAKRDGKAVTDRLYPFLDRNHPDVKGLSKVSRKAKKKKKKATSKNNETKEEVPHVQKHGTLVEEVQKDVTASDAQQLRSGVDDSKTTSKAAQTMDTKDAPSWVDVGAASTESGGSEDELDKGTERAAVVMEFDMAALTGRSKSTTVSAGTEEDDKHMEQLVSEGFTNRLLNTMLLRKYRGKGGLDAVRKELQRRRRLALQKAKARKGRSSVRQRVPSRAAKQETQDKFVLDPSRYKFPDVLTPLGRRVLGCDPWPLED